MNNTHRASIKHRNVYNEKSFFTKLDFKVWLILLASLNSTAILYKSFRVPGLPVLPEGVNVALLFVFARRLDLFISNFLRRSSSNLSSALLVAASKSSTILDLDTLISSDSCPILQKLYINLTYNVRLK